MKPTPFLVPLLLSLPLAAAEPLLPLPEAPVVVVSTDPAALDRALAGGFRQALSGTLPEDDPVARGLRQTRVGGKLDDQRALLAADLPLSWTEIAATKPTALGLALLSAGDLEAVLAIRTPLAQLPFALPAGEARSRNGVPYAFVARGAGDERTLDRRMGLAWARLDGTLIVATSERALHLALDRAAAGQGFGAFLPGLVSARLDLAALRADRYFRREFLFAEGVRGADRGTLLCALRAEEGRLVEVREGESGSAPAAVSWSLDGRSVAAAGWEADGTRFPEALRRGLLEPLPVPSERPRLARRPLPDPDAAQGERYLVDLTRPVPPEGEGDAAELPRWAALFGELKLEGWGWEIGADGARRLLARIPKEREAAFLGLARETLARRAGRADSSPAALTVGPALPALAWSRRGDWLWLAADEAHLAKSPAPAAEAGLVRWSRLDLDAVRAEKGAWRDAEGASFEGNVRPFSDRILGLLGWAPRSSAVAVERRQEGSRFRERIVFSSR